MLLLPLLFQKMSRVRYGNYDYDDGTYVAEGESVPTIPAASSGRGPDFGVEP